MSPRAAWRLEQLGFTVRDYRAGKLDWLAHGLDYDGTGDLVSRHLRDVPTCTTDESLGSLRARVDPSSPVDTCAVLADGLLVGTVDLAGIAPDDARAVGDAMVFGVTTIRPSEDVEGVISRMRERNVSAAWVTDPSARFLGTFDPSRR